MTLQRLYRIHTAASIAACALSIINLIWIVVYFSTDMISFWPFILVSMALVATTFIGLALVKRWIWARVEVFMRSCTNYILRPMNMTFMWRKNDANQAEYYIRHKSDTSTYKDTRALNTGEILELLLALERSPTEQYKDIVTALFHGPTFGIKPTWEKDNDAN